MKKIVILFAALFFVACSTPKPNSPGSNNNVSKASETTSATASTATSNNVSSTSTRESDAAAKLAAQNNSSQPDSNTSDAANQAAEIQKLHNESVYFDYNEYSLKPEFRGLIEKQAASFKNRKTSTLNLEGNADERGSAAYNLALGEKRATAVKKVLVTLGVPASKIKVVSYGNTKPKLDCHEEKCWKENRRVDFVFKQK
jgi:peptidoglycan-associated lipoprotein